MLKSTESQKKFMTAAAIIIAALSVVIIGISIGRGNGFPFFALPLITVSAALIVVAGSLGKKKQ